MVVTSAIFSLAKLTELRLLPLNYIVGVVEKTVMLVLHPSDAIRTSIINLISATSLHLGTSDTYVHIMTLLQPYVRHAVIGFNLNVSSLREVLVAPINRTVFNSLLLDCRSKLLNSSSSAQGSSNTAANVVGGEIMELSTVVIDVDASNSSPISGGVKSALFTQAHWSPSLNGGFGEGNDKKAIAGHAFKIKCLQRYVELVAREIHKKTSQYRFETRTNAVSAGRRQSFGLIGMAPQVDSVFDQADISPTLANLVQHFVVPSQRNSLKNFANEEVRKCDLERMSVTDIDCVKEMYGVSINNADIARTLALGENATDHQRNGTGKISETLGADPLSLFRKIKAIPLPPVSPNLGCLMQPTDGRKYR